MSETFCVEPIGWVRCERTEVLDDGWDTIPATIELDTDRFNADAFLGLEGFSYVEIIFLFDQVEEDKIVTGARHPRGRKTWPKTGIFAQRGKNRPNRLGATICRVVSVYKTRLRLAGLDAIDGTPVIDIKPVMSGFLPRGDVAEPDWAKEIMSSYW